MKNIHNANQKNRTDITALKGLEAKTLNFVSQDQFMEVSEKLEQEKQRVNKLVEGQKDDVSETLERKMRIFSLDLKANDEAREEQINQI